MAKDESVQAGKLPAALVAIVVKNHDGKGNRIGAFAPFYGTHSALDYYMDVLGLRHPLAENALTSSPLVPIEGEALADSIARDKQVWRFTGEGEESEIPGLTRQGFDEFADRLALMAFDFRNILVGFLHGVPSYKPILEAAIARASELKGNRSKLEHAEQGSVAAPFVTIYGGVPVIEYYARLLALRDPAETDGYRMGDPPVLQGFLERDRKVWFAGEPVEGLLPLTEQGRAEFQERMARLPYLELDYLTPRLPADFIPLMRAVRAKLTTPRASDPS